ncbi:IMPACT family protein [Chitinibacter sp. S2-10]|uniref:IMPACT family protein n=1 Tax=Chitinibacter sp. S2-10 TaxID=3373597 RepID=UPI00397731E7
MPFTIKSPVEHELIIKKSRFLACVMPMNDRANAQQIVASLKAAHPGAAHVCWALLAGGQSAAVDDGEPSGTAGRPMLDVLRHQELEGVLATVVRYFGGVKLGAGGLVRAYTDSVAQALLQAEKIPLLKLRTLRCTVPYSLEGHIRRALAGYTTTGLAVEHGSQVIFSFAITADTAETLIAQLNESCHGQLGWLNT